MTLNNGISMEYLQSIANKVQCLEELYVYIETYSISSKDFSRVQLVLDIFPSVRNFIVISPLIILVNCISF